MPSNPNDVKMFTKEEQFMMPAGFDENDKKTRDKCLYLKQLLADKRTMAQMPGAFTHLDRLLDDEIVKVRSVLFQNNTKPLELPMPTGKTVTLSKKVFVPAKDYPDYNFVGRILGPRGLTAKQLEQETGCKIMVRGKGSMRDKKKEEQNKGRPNWEHLNEELHVLITVEDSENRADVKLQRATQEIEKLLVPQSEGEDDLKKKQLMELAIINGTYRDNSNGKMAAANGMSRLSMPGLLQSTNPAFRMPNLMSQMMTPGLMNTSMLRPPISINSSMQNMEQPTLYYAPMDASQYSYAALNGLNGLMGASGLDYASANVSPNEMMGSTGVSQGSSSAGPSGSGGPGPMKVARTSRPTLQPGQHPYARPQGTVIL